MNTTRKKKILITFGRSFLSLDLARQWHAQGHEVFVADSIKAHVSRFSKAVNKSFSVPSPRFQPDQYLDAIVEIVEREKIDLLIPIYEEIIHLSKAVSRFPKHCKVFCPSYDIYEKLQNKWLFQELLREMEIPCLKTSLIRDKSELLKLQFPVEYALKPCYSRASKMVCKVQPNQAPPNIEIASYNPWVAQEWAYGNRYCTYSICHEGNLYAHGTYPVDYAIDGHSCINFEAINQPKVVEWISRFVKSIGYSGQIAFDFIEDNKGTLYAIECNPRATSGLLLFSEADRLDRAFLRQNEQPIFPREGSSRQIAAGMLLYGWRKSARQHHSLSNFLKVLFSTKDVILNRNDLKPFLFEPFVFANLWIRSQKLGISIPDYFTFDHDWNNCKSDLYRC